MDTCRYVGCTYLRITIFYYPENRFLYLGTIDFSCFFSIRFSRFSKHIKSDGKKNYCDQNILKEPKNNNTILFIKNFSKSLMTRKNLFEKRDFFACKNNISFF